MDTEKEKLLKEIEEYTRKNPGLAFSKVSEEIKKKFQRINEIELGALNSKKQ